MPNHLHLELVGLSDNSDAISLLHDFKGNATLQARTLGIRNLWEKSFYDHILRDDDNHDAVAWYIFNNPVRKGLAGGADIAFYVCVPVCRVATPRAQVFTAAAGTGRSGLGTGHLRLHIWNSKRGRGLFDGLANPNAPAAQSVALPLVRATGVKRFQVTANLSAPWRAPIAP